MEGHPPTGTSNEPTQPERREQRRGGCAVVALGACVFAVLLVAGYLGYRAYVGRDVQRQVQRADEHARDVPTRLVKVQQEIASADIGVPTDARRALGDASREVDRVERELTLARQDAAAIADPRVARPYVASLDEDDAAVRSARDALSLAGRFADVEERAHKGLQKANAGTELIASAIGAGNEEDYSTQEEKARQASALLAEAERLFVAAAEVDSASDLGQAATWAGKSRAEADAIGEQAVAGQSGDVVEYNRAVDVVNSLTGEVDTMEHPAALTDAHWADARLAPDLQAVRQHAVRTSAALGEAYAAVGTL